VAIQKLGTLLRGRVRLARGRCPSCASEARAAVACGVCRDFRGPFPAEPRTLQRWSWRFERTLRLTPAAAPHPAWSRVAEPAAR
jgi:hypothetical protein